MAGKKDFYELLGVNKDASDQEIKKGIWLREENRGYELDYLTIGIIGYGNMGKSFAKKLRGFDCQVLCYDIKENVGDSNAQQVSLKEFQNRVDVVSLHTPETPLTKNMINSEFINAFSKNFWLINTARGKSVNTAHLVEALKSGKIKGAGLDVLEDMRKALTGKRITRKIVEGVLKKSIKKVATRLSGVVGVSITVAEFGVCLAIAS